jgi:alpha-L-fucosidase 2
MYGSRGWVAHTVCNAWGYTSPGWGVSWGMNVSGGAWLATHLWSHYLYTNDKQWLATTGYPLLKKTAEFFIDYMTIDPNTHYLVTGPSISPENGYVTTKGSHLSLAMMPTIDRDIVHYI